MAQSPWRDPTQAVILDQALIVKAIGAGVRNGTWVCSDAASGRVLTQAQPQGQVRIGADSMLYTLQRATELGLLPKIADAPPTPSGPESGAEVTAPDSPGGDSGETDSPRRILEAQGGAAAALQKLDDSIRDAGVHLLARVEVRVAAEAGQGVQPFRVLGMCVPQARPLRCAAEAQRYSRVHGSIGCCEARLRRPRRCVHAGV